jgi:hypothetical protein
MLASLSFAVCVYGSGGVYVIIQRFVSTPFIPIPPMPRSLGPLEPQAIVRARSEEYLSGASNDNQGDPSRHRFFSA